MAKTKLKTPVTSKKQQALQVPSRKVASVTESTVWQSEMEALQSKVFSSVEQALDTLITNVVSRLGKPGAKGAQEREFVKLLLETDPELMETLTRSVRIK